MTGLRAQRRAHIPIVIAAISSLGGTIYYAEGLGELYDLESAGAITPVHLTIARITAVAYLAPIVTRVRTLRNPRGRRLHGRVAFTVLALTAVTALTGVIMILLSDPI